MHTHQALEGRVLVVRPSGHLLGGDETAEIIDTAREFAEREAGGVVLDLEDVDYMNSLGLGAITRLLVTCNRHHGVLKVCNIEGRVRRLFDVVKFYKIFEYHDSQDAALAAMTKELTHPAR